MKKITSLLLVFSFLVLFIVSVTGCDLFKSIDLDEVKANLESAGYTVTVKTGAEYVMEDNDAPTVTSSELDYYLYGVKDSDVIHLFFFVSVDAASDNADFIYINSQTSGQNNSVVYFATRQAKKDAGI